MTNFLTVSCVSNIGSKYSRMDQVISRPYHLKFFKGCLPKVLLGPFLNAFTLYVLTSKFWSLFWPLALIERHNFYEDLTILIMNWSELKLLINQQLPAVIWQTLVCFRSPNTSRKIQVYWEFLNLRKLILAFFVKVVRVDFELC